MTYVISKAKTCCFKIFVCSQFSISTDYKHEEEYVVHLVRDDRTDDTHIEKEMRHTNKHTKGLL